MSPAPASPPSYEASVSSSPSPSSSSSPNQPLLTHVASLPSRNLPPPKGASPAGTDQSNGPLVHYFVQPGPNGRMISTNLGPETEEMRCLMEGHLAQSKFGIIGILSTIFFFPWGLAVCALDRKVVCKRCKQVIDPGCL
ncbi:hypothetical protein BDY24DRAFT_382208 [Mrakia frigida]|uniref:uncharacterized protein n=1 Tax=Mrakia frigida TaxID=29902 RepID=UPI003FCC1383